MKRWMIGLGFVVLLAILGMTRVTVFSQRETTAPAPPPLQAPNQDVPILDNVPSILFESNRFTRETTSASGGNDQAGVNRTRERIDASRRLALHVRRATTPTAASPRD